MSEIIKNTFPKSERLRHHSLVEKLFAEGQSLYEYPLRLVWRVMDAESLTSNFRDHVPDGIAPLQVMVTVPKKRRRHAVDRVRMRRLIREAWRLSRRPLRSYIETETGLRTVSVAIIYMANENLPYDKIASRLAKLQQHLLAKLSGSNDAKSHE